ncbi:MAG: tyrosine-type recombinase/integrase [Agathobaculum sp.]|jgi:integrase/recombinase XerD|uniref:tyrosine-type recombinase/integrase n=1 Tax=Agathobaculum sp. TaxID=2048138 RepID=UPI003D8BE41F
MNKYILTLDHMTAYVDWLKEEERTQATIEKYLHDIWAFVRWLHGRPVAKELVMEWKQELLSAHRAPSTINAALSALNGLFRFLGWEGFRTRFLKVQRRMFRDQSREMTREDYRRLVSAARRLERERLALLMETICATGIRVSEVKYITVEAANHGRAEIAMKGKIRVILIAGKLCRKLQNYARKQKIASGEIFLTGSGKGLSRRQIWTEMKWLCKYAGVEPSHVFPHNLRHFFAVTFYRVCRDIAKLADMLSHSSIETTRIYLLTSGAEHQKYLERMGLVI